MASKIFKKLSGSSKSCELLEELDPVTCPICLMIFEKALTVSCGHTFCSNCLMNFNVPEPVCPICRQKFIPSKTTKSSEIIKMINSHRGKCSFCHKEMPLKKLRNHHTECLQFKEQVQSLSISIPKNEDRKVNRHTFKCPYCELRNLDTNGLVKHVNENHSDTNAKVTCPICSSMPWGDPNQLSSNFIGHLNHRHQFEYDTFVDYEIDDQTALEHALKASLEGDESP